MAASPSILNYYIGKGDLYFKPAAGTWRHFGNVPVIEWTPEVEELEHQSSRSGVKTTDRTVVLAKKGTLKLTLDEWSVQNLALALLGEIASESDGTEVIEIFGATSISGEVKFVGQNAVGPKYVWHFRKIDFIPGSSINPISDEWGQLEVTGRAATVAGSFGTVTKAAEEGGAVPSELTSGLPA